MGGTHYRPGVTWDEYLEAVQTRLEKDWNLELATTELRRAGLPNPVRIAVGGASPGLELEVSANDAAGLNVIISPWDGGLRVEFGTPMLALLKQFCYCLAGCSEHYVGPDGAVAARAISLRTARKHFRAAFEQSLIGATPPTETPAVSELGRLEAELLLEASVSFALSHEVGHALAGHLDPQLTHVASELPLPAARIPEHIFSAADELTADQVGVILTLFRVERVNEVWLFGPIVVFELLDMIDRGRLQRNAPSGDAWVPLRQGAQSTHPLPAQRRATVVAKVEAFVPSIDELRNSDRLLARIEALIDKPLKDPDLDALGKLLALSNEQVANTLREIFFQHRPGSLVRTIDNAAAARVLGDRLEVATTTLATAAEMYLDLVLGGLRVGSVHCQAMLGHLYIMYRSEYIKSNPSRAAKRFDVTLRRAVPDLDECVRVYVQLSTWVSV